MVAGAWAGPSAVSGGADIIHGSVHEGQAGLGFKPSSGGSVSVHFQQVWWEQPPQPSEVGWDPPVTCWVIAGSLLFTVSSRAQAAQDSPQSLDGEGCGRGGALTCRALPGLAPSLPGPLGL